MSQSKACVSLGNIQAYVEVLESLPYRELTPEQLDTYMTTARALLRSSNHLLEALLAVRSEE